MAGQPSSRLPSLMSACVLRISLIFDFVDFLCQRPPLIPESSSGIFANIAVFDIVVGLHCAGRLYRVDARARGASKPCLLRSHQRWQDAGRRSCGDSDAARGSEASHLCGAVREHRQFPHTPASANVRCMRAYRLAWDRADLFRAHGHAHIHRLHRVNLILCSGVRLIMIRLMSVGPGEGGVLPEATGRGASAGARVLFWLSRYLEPILVVQSRALSLHHRKSQRNRQPLAP